MNKNYQSLLLGFVVLLFVFQIKISNAGIPLPTLDMSNMAENAKSNMELVKSYKEKVEKVMNAVQKIQNGGYAEGAGDLLYMYESGEFSGIGADLSKFSENSKNAFKSKEKLEKEAKEKAEKEKAEKEALEKEAEEKGITYEQLMVEKERERQRQLAEERAKKAEEARKAEEKRKKWTTWGKAGIAAADGDFEGALGNINTATGGYLTGNRQEQAKDKDGNLLFDEDGNPIMETKRSWAQSIYQDYVEDKDLYKDVWKAGDAIYDTAKNGGSLVDIGKSLADSDRVEAAVKSVADSYEGSNVEQSVNAWNQRRKEKKKEKEMKENLDELVKAGPVGLPEMEIPAQELPDTIPSLDEMATGWGGVQ